MPVLDLSSQECPARAFEEWQRGLFETSFEIDDAELFHACLVKLAEDDTRYVGRAHHAMMDGWGFSNWARLLRQSYEDFEAAPEAGIAWQEVARDDEQYLASEKYETDKQYWKEHVKEIAPALIPPRYQGLFAGEGKVPSRRKIIEISRAQLNEYEAMAAAAGGGAAHYFLAMLAIYFRNSSETERLVFGLPFHNRRDHRQKQMLGVFTSISPLAIDMEEGKETAGALIGRIARLQKANFRHQRYPLGHIIRDVAGQERRSLYDVGFNYLKVGQDLSFDGKSATLVYLSHHHEATPLMVTLCEYGHSGSVQLQLDYNLAHLNDSEASLLADRFSCLLQRMRGVAEPVARMEILPEAEVQRLCRGYGDGPLAHKGTKCIHQLFEEQAGRTPGNAAVAAGKEVLTYAELNRRANRVARHLRALGVKPEKLVGIYMDRTAEMLAGVLGILKAGGAYVPLEKSYPAARIRTILQDGGIQLVLTQSRFADFFVALPVQPAYIDAMDASPPREDANPDPAGLAPANLAYVIHTSGSTGRPKGVQICHGSAVALLDWVKTVYAAEHLDKVLASTSLSFDLSVFEIFAPLSMGGCCVVVNNALELLENPSDVSLINTVPSAAKVLIEQKAIPARTQVVNLAGEPLPMHVVNDLLAASRCEKVFNLYGPSEDTTYSTYALFQERIAGTPDIGRAIAGTKLYVLSPSGRLAATGTPGELYIAGDGLARGYLNSPYLTAEKFLPNPFSAKPGDRLYKTGDLVRYAADGALEYIGRADDQVKIRGFRIEPGEIQKQLEQMEGVKTAVVLAVGQTSADRSLAAFVQRKPGLTQGDEEFGTDLWEDELQRAIRTCLPEYMVPAITVVDEVPLTPNGKIDKKALLKMAASRVSQRESAAEMTATESRLAALWAKLLGVECAKIGPATSLFDFGGHSLLLVKLANEIGAELEVQIPLRIFFETRNLRDVARAIDVETMLQLVEQKSNSAVIIEEGYL